MWAPSPPVSPLTALPVPLWVLFHPHWFYTSVVPRDSSTAAAPCLASHKAYDTVTSKSQLSMWAFCFLSREVNVSSHSLRQMLSICDCMVCRFIVCCGKMPTAWLRLWSQRKNWETTKKCKIIHLGGNSFILRLFLFFVLSWFLWSAEFQKIGIAPFKRLLYNTAASADCFATKLPAMLTYVGSISSVCHLSLMIYCGKPQTPQEDVATQRQPHCRLSKMRAEKSHLPL